MRNFFKCTCLIACLFFVSLQVSAQSKEAKAAKKLFELESYMEAADMYKKALAKAKDKGDMLFKIGECYRLVNNFKQADSYYGKAIKAGFEDPIGILMYAQVLRKLEKYDEAIAQFNNYLAKKPDDAQAKEWIAASKMAKEWKQEKNRIKVEPLKTFNTINSDYGVALYKNNGVVFSSTREDAAGKALYGRTGDKFTDLFESFIDKNGRWSTPQPITGGINTNIHEGAATINRTGTEMYFTRCSNKDGDCRIFYSRKQGNDWSEAELVSFFNDTITVGHPALSYDGKVLYFVAREAPGGLGGRDIWYSVKSGKDWGAPVNLGPNINTKEDEMFPYYHRDSTLFFSSLGHMGMGGLDIFSSKGEGKNWTKAENMKWPINSGADDFAYVANPARDKGFLSSNRDGGRGNDDIWQWSITPLVFNVAGVISNETTGALLDSANVKLLMPDSTFIEAITNAKGEYKFELEKETKYGILVNKTDYFGKSSGVSTIGKDQSEDFVVNVALLPIPKEEITLEDILYDLDSANLRSESETSLDKLVKLLQESPNLKIGIYSHTDSRGSDKYNLDLSQRRAQSVVNYLISKGIDTLRLTARGFGETRLLNKCANGVQCTEEEHQINRRTTFKVLSSDFEGKIFYKRVTGEKVKSEGSTDFEDGVDVKEDNNVEEVPQTPQPTPPATPKTNTTAPQSPKKP